MEDVDVGGAGEPLYMTWNGGYVAFSYFLSFLGAMVAIELNETRRTTGLYSMKRFILTGLIGFTLGTATIWCLHFIGMTAMHLHRPVTVEGVDGFDEVIITYDVAMTFTSWLVSVMFLTIGVSVASQDKVFRDVRLTISRRRLPFTQINKDLIMRIVLFSDLHWVVGGGVVSAMGVCAMHYIGMAAQVTEGKMHFDVAYIVGSAVLANVAMIAAYWMIFRFLVYRPQLHYRLLSGMLVAAGVCSMHYTGMYSAIYRYTPGVRTHPVQGLEKTSHMSAEDISLCAFSLSYAIFALFFMGTLADTRIMQYRAEKELILLRKHYGLPCNATPDIEAQFRMAASSRQSSLKRQLTKTSSTHSQDSKSGSTTDNNPHSSSDSVGANGGLHTSIVSPHDSGDFSFRDALRGQFTHPVIATTLYHDPPSHYRSSILPSGRTKKYFDSSSIFDSLSASGPSPPLPPLKHKEISSARRRKSSPKFASAAARRTTNAKPSIITSKPSHAHLSAAHMSSHRITTPPSIARDGSSDSIYSFQHPTASTQRSTLAKAVLATSSKDSLRALEQSPTKVISLGGLRRSSRHSRSVSTDPVSSSADSSGPRKRTLSSKENANALDVPLREAPAKRSRSKKKKRLKKGTKAKSRRAANSLPPPGEDVELTARRPFASGSRISEENDEHDRIAEHV